MLALIPFVHAPQRFIGLVNGEYRPLGEGIQLLVRDDRGDLDDDVGIGLQPGHFEIDPDEVVGAAHASVTCGGGGQSSRHVL